MWLLSSLITSLFPQVHSTDYTHGAGKQPKKVHSYRERKQLGMPMLSVCVPACGVCAHACVCSLPAGRASDADHITLTGGG